MDSNSLRKKVHEIIDTNDHEIIHVVYTLLQTNDAQFLLGSSVEEYNKDLSLAENAIDSGKFITQEDLEDEAKKW